jgi:hypothetical protein
VVVLPARPFCHGNGVSSLADGQHPIRQRAARQFDAVAAEDLLLSRQGQVIAELLHRDVGEQAGRGQPLLDHLRR